LAVISAQPTFTNATITVRIGEDVGAITMATTGVAIPRSDTADTLRKVSFQPVLAVRGLSPLPQQSGVLQAG